ncbi:MAG: hypothetical protein WDA68_05285 [Phycisphaerae bacterium]
MKPENENLEELFGKFLNENDARKAAEDITQGEKLLNEYPAPKPEAALLLSIQARINNKLRQTKKHRSISIGYWSTATAAAVLIIGFISITLLNRTQHPQITDRPAFAVSLETEDDFLQDDYELLLLAAQLQDIEDEFMAVQSGLNGYYSNIADELEIELLEINSDFWKG